MPNGTRICEADGCSVDISEKHPNARSCSRLCAGRVQTAKFRAANPDYRRQYNRMLYEKDPTAIKARVAKWQKDNPERHKANMRRAYSNNPRPYTPKRGAITTAWKRAHPLEVIAIESRRRAQKLGSAVAPVTANQIAARMAYWGDKCWMCRGPFEQVDHVKPLSKGGMHSLSNFRPACSSCNASKGGKWSGVANLPRFMRPTSCK